MNQPAGWYTDPFNQEQERFWDGKVWTMHDRPPGSADQTPPSGFQAASPSSPGAPGPRPAGPTSVGDLTMFDGQSFTTSVPPQAHRRTMLLSAVAVRVLVVGGVGIAAYVVLGGHNSAAASEAVAKAVTQSLNEQTADISLDADVSTAGLNEHITATGAFNLATHSGTMTITLPDGGPQSSEQVIEDGSTVYVSMPTVLGALLPGKGWVSADASTLASGDSGLGSDLNGMDDPSAMLHQLQNQGDPVASLGPSTFEGTSVNEYSVTIPLSRLENDLGQLPADDRQLASGTLPSSITEKVYIDDTGLLRGVVVPISISLDDHSLSETVQMSYSNYGTPVTVTPPPANEVATLQQFEAAAGQSGASGLGGFGDTGDSGNTGNTGLLGNSGDTGKTA